MGLGRFTLLTAMTLVAPISTQAESPLGKAPRPPLLPMAGPSSGAGLFAEHPEPEPSPRPSPTAAKSDRDPNPGDATVDQARSASIPIRSLWPSGATAPTSRPQPPEAGAQRTESVIGSWLAITPRPATMPVNARPIPTNQARGPAIDPSSDSKRSRGTHVPTGLGAGRFDPDLGPATHVVSDSSGASSEEGTVALGDADFVSPAPVFPLEPEKRAASPSEHGGDVSLVAWLARSYSELFPGDASAGDAETASGVCITDCGCPTWQIQTDALFLWQGNLPARSLYIDSETQQTVLDAYQMQTRAAIAPRYAITYNRDDCRAVEVNYFQAYGFNATQQLGAPDFPSFNAAGDGAYTIDNVLGLSYDTIGYIQATGSAHIKSFEVNLRRRQEGGLVQWISGFRWLEWGQSLTMVDATYQNFDPTPVGADVLSVMTLNNLYGWQFGGDMTIWNAGRWVRINGVGKAGLYYNHKASQNTYYDNGVVEPILVGDSKDVASFVGETGLNASVSLTRWLSWRLGYSFFWLGGVAVPTRQLSLTDVPNGTTSVNANSSIFIQAATTGLEARW